MKKIKKEVDDIVIERTRDREGYDAYRVVFKREGRVVDIIIFSDITHRKVSEKASKIMSEKYIFVSKNPPHQE